MSIIDLLNRFLIFLGECLGRDILQRENSNLHLYWDNELCPIPTDSGQYTCFHSSETEGDFQKASDCIRYVYTKSVKR